MRMIFMLGLVLGAIFVPASVRAETIPIISETAVHQRDPVSGLPGTPRHALREGTTVRWFASQPDSEEFTKAPRSAIDVRYVVALNGADVVELFPEGVEIPVNGPVVPGRVDYAVNYKGSTFLFSSQRNMDRFSENPAMYTPPVGLYCLGAMSLGRVTPGDPRHIEYVQGIGWAVFGSENGPKAWRWLEKPEALSRLATAEGHYRRLTGQ